MEALYHRTNGLLEDVHRYFGQLEKSKEETPASIELIQTTIDKITSNCERLDILVNKEPPSTRSNAKLRVDQIKYDCQHLQASLRKVQQKRMQYQQQLRDREELLSRKFAPNDANTTILIDQALQQNQSLHNSHRGIDDLLGSGSGILGNLRDQRSTLKGAHKKVLDVANTLGISNTVMRLIEKRAHWDKFVLYGGMIFTCLIMCIIVKYFYL